ncbi:MAG: tol-pal system protein YbgF [Desulfuromusa sp.]|nr:tol-pal system protein YbgF [Desulfuromusa sp.]
MRVPHPTPIIKLIPILGFVLLFSSCAPTTGIAPSGALKQQLHEIKQQQQEQATQLQQLQQKINQLQQQLTAENLVSEQIQDNIESPQQAGATSPIIIVSGSQSQVLPNQEAVKIAASASSYLEAFSNLAAGNFATAETGFQDFLREFPDHQYSPNARYWLASAQLSQDKTNLAINNLRLIISNPDAQKKKPAALMQLAQIYQQQGLQIQADNVLEQLRSNYPESPEAQHFYRSEEPNN